MNQQVSAAAIANELITYYIPGGVFHLEDEMYRSWGDENGISVPYEHSSDYVAALGRLLETNMDVQSSYSFATFEREVAGWLYPAIIGKTSVDANSVKAFFKELTSFPLADHDVFRPIFGITLAPKPEATTIGPYTIYATAKHLEPVVGKLKENVKEIFLDDTSPYLIKVTVRARESNKALELAGAWFERFENIVRFMLGQRVSVYEVGILNYHRPTRKRAIVMSAELVSSSSEKENLTRVLPIDDTYFLAPGKGFDFIWANLTSTSNSELTKRLFLAMEWMGQSYAENVPSSAFIKAAISLEILFTPQLGEFFTPAIGAQLAESVALFLGADVASRVKLEADIKYLYNVRSEIAHAGKKELKGAALARMHWLARDVIMKMLTMPSMREITTVIDMYKLFKTFRYSCPPM